MKKKLSIIINLFIGIVSYASWINMTFFTMESNALTTTNFSNLKYFTVLSNLLNGTICLIYTYYLIKNKEITENKKTLKLLGTTAVGLTFITVMVFLGPLYGYKMMFTGSNFYLHLILPVLSFITFIFLENNKVKLKNTLYCILPTLIYSIGYLTNIFINGIGKWPNRNDFYSFLEWGYAVGAVIFIVMLLITWIISLILNLCSNKINKENNK